MEIREYDQTKHFNIIVTNINKKEVSVEDYNQVREIEDDSKIDCEKNNIYLFFDSEDRAWIYNNFNYNFDEGIYTVTHFKPALRYYLCQFDDNSVFDEINSWLGKDEEVYEEE